MTGASKANRRGHRAKPSARKARRWLWNYARDHEGAERVVREITGKGGRATAVQGDVAQRSDAQRIVAEAKKGFGRLDVLVNNAGVFSFAPFEQFSEQEFHRQFNTNVLGTFLMIEAALSAFGAEGGSIINIGSTESVAADPTLSIYVASKSAVDGLTRVLSKEFGPRKIRRQRSQSRWNRNGGCVRGGPSWARSLSVARLSPVRRWAAWANPRTSRAWRHFSPQMMRAGSREKSSSRTAATSKTTSGE